MSQPATDPRHTYIVSSRDESQTIEGRTEAMEVAKNLSKERRGGVEVQSQDGRLRVRFSGGQVESYVLDTPGTRGRKR